MLMRVLRALFYQMVLNTISQVAKANECLGGHDIFASVWENSPTQVFIADLNFIPDPGASSLRLCLTGENADWFFLDGKTIRLNTSASRVLDREVQGSILIAALKCYEDDVMQSEYRLMVEILNENDNRPAFLGDPIRPFDISELTAVNTAVFSLEARDADDDTIMYVIDKLSDDASYFKIDLPNSGRVVLAKPLDYETKTQMRITVHAVEMNTQERYNDTVKITVNVLDGDDQYPQFLPCIALSGDKENPICMNPVYTVNITEAEEDILLYFYPGPIRAVDGDRGIRTTVIYTILSGADNGRFCIDNQTGDVMLMRRVQNRLLTPILRLRIMASQRDDPKKYTVTTALIRVQAENRFPPQFNRTLYKGFVTESSSLASLVSTYGNMVLVIQATDRDFEDGLNPKIRYSLSPRSNTAMHYHITQEGHLIAKANLLQAFDRHIIQVLARDQESGDQVNASIDIEVLRKGQPVPHSPFTDERLYGIYMDLNVVGSVAGVALVVLVVMLLLLLQFAKWRRKRQNPTEGGSVAEGKQPNVGNVVRPMPHTEDISYHSEALGDCDSSGSPLCGKQGIYTPKEEIPHTGTNIWNYNVSQMPTVAPPVFTIPSPLSPTRSLSPLFTYNGASAERWLAKSVSFREGETDNSVATDETVDVQLTKIQTLNERQLGRDQSKASMSARRPSLGEVAVCERVIGQKEDGHTNGEDTE